MCTRVGKGFCDNLHDKGLRRCSSCAAVKNEGLFRGSFCIECANAIDRNQYALTIEKRAEKYKKKRNANDYFVYKFVDDNNQIVYI